MKQTFGEKVASLRKEHGMTQLQLAEQMGVTDKAVSKWERNLSLPDVNSIPKLAEILGVSVDDLMQVESTKKEEQLEDLVKTIFKAVAVAMGVAVVALEILDKLDVHTGFIMLGIGLLCLGLLEIQKDA